MRERGVAREKGCLVSGGQGVDNGVVRVVRVVSVVIIISPALTTQRSLQVIPVPAGRSDAYRDVISGLI